MTAQELLQSLTLLDEHERIEAMIRAKLGDLGYGI